ncbi:MAG: amino acid-binding protein, partial [Clostridiales bacterium]
VPDSPGGLNTVLEILEKAEVNLEYAYAFCNDDEDYALTIFRVDKENEASQALLQEGINVLAGEKVYSM